MDGATGVSEFQVVQSAGGATTIWPVDRLLPEGWQATGITGSKAECLGAINRGTSVRPVPSEPLRRGEGFWRILPVHRQVIGAFLAGEDLR